jgi:heme exporter protein A
MQARLSAINIACRRGDRVLFSGLDLSLESGNALHITGANGVGKTSLLRILAGLMPAFAGEISHRGDIGLLDERPALDPELPLGKTLGFWARLDRANGLQDVTARLNLTDLLDVPVRYLSTGQRKRAALARLLGQQAQIWLLDEPLSGLDEASRGLVDQLASEHISHGGLCVIASHQPLAIEGLQSLALEEFVQ